MTLCSASLSFAHEGGSTSVERAEEYMLNAMRWAPARGRAVAYPCFALVFPGAEHRAAVAQPAYGLVLRRSGGRPRACSARTGRPTRRARRPRQEPDAARPSVSRERQQHDATVRDWTRAR